MSADTPQRDEAAALADDPELRAAVETLKSRGYKASHVIRAMRALESPPPRYSVAESSGRWHVFRDGDMVEEPTDDEGDFATRSEAVAASWSHARGTGQ